MIKNFHGNEIELNEYTRGGTTYVDCLVEGKERILTPEEEVRQAVIKHLLREIISELARFYIRVEYRSLDVVFYFVTGVRNFSPPFCPALIIETKRDYLNLDDFESQISNYLIRDNCENGLLLNSQRIIHFTKAGSVCQKRDVDVPDLVSIISNIATPFSDLEVSAFQAACQGDFESFRMLAVKYGKKGKMSFLCKGLNAPIQNAFWVKIIGDQLCFDISGEVSQKRQNRVRVDSFQKLLSITN